MSTCIIQTRPMHVYIYFTLYKSNKTLNLNHKIILEKKKE